MARITINAAQILLCALGLGVASVSAKPPAFQPADSARLSFSQAEVDLGKIQKGQTKSYALTLSNTGKKPLKITRIHTYCSCLQGKMDLEKKIPSGKSAPFTITLDTTEPPVGAFQKILVIFSNDPFEPNKNIAVKAEILPSTATSSSPQKNP